MNIIVELMKKNDITSKDIKKIIELRKIESLESKDRRFYDEKIHRLIDFRRDLIKINLKNEVIEKIFESIERTRKSRKR